MQHEKRLWVVEQTHVSETVEIEIEQKLWGTEKEIEEKPWGFLPAKFTNLVEGDPSAQVPLDFIKPRGGHLGLLPTIHRRDLELMKQGLRDVAVIKRGDIKRGSCFLWTSPNWICSKFGRFKASRTVLGFRLENGLWALVTPWTKASTLQVTPAVKAFL